MPPPDEQRRRPRRVQQRGARDARRADADRSPAAGRRRSRIGGRARYSIAERGARARLKRFRRASVLAVGATGMLLLLFGVPETAGSQDTTTAPSADSVAASDASDDPAAAVEEATGTLQDLGEGLLALWPKVAIALALLFGAALLATLIRTALRMTSTRWEKAEAISALGSVVIWLLALGAALSVVAGDATALVGFVGFFGLALSWALQAPIESFSGWLLNSFRGYYRGRRSH